MTWSTCCSKEISSTVVERSLTFAQTRLPHWNAALTINTPTSLIVCQPYAVSESTGSALFGRVGERA